MLEGGALIVLIGKSKNGTEEVTMEQRALTRREFLVSYVRFSRGVGYARAAKAIGQVPPKTKWTRRRGQNRLLLVACGAGQTECPTC